MIIALQGVGSIGKTTTLKILLRKISDLATINKCGLNNPVYRKDNHLRKAEYLTDLLQAKGTDVYAVFIWNGKRIGITTQGDEAKYLKAAFKKLEVCDIYVCAARSRGGTIKFLTEKDKNCIFLSKTKSSSAETQLFLNQGDAQKIFELLRSATEH